MDYLARTHTPGIYSAIFYSAELIVFLLVLTASSFLRSVLKISRPLAIRALRKAYAG